MTDQPLVTPLRAAVVVTLGGLATIAGAWAFELIGGLEPCPLCLEQRWPYYIGVPIALAAALVAARGKARAAGIVLAIVCAIMAYGAGLGAYHAGIEWHWWQGPAACSGGGALPSDAASLAESLQRGRVPSCTEATWRLAGLSLAGWNAVIALALAAIAGLGAASARRGDAAGPARPEQTQGSSSTSQ